MLCLNDEYPSRTHNDVIHIEPFTRNIVENIRRFITKLIQRFSDKTLAFKPFAISLQHQTSFFDFHKSANYKHKRNYRQCNCAE